MKKIDGFIGVACSLRTKVIFHYYLYEDEQKELHIQIDKSNSRGTYSSLLYSVSEYKNERHIYAPLGRLNGYDLSEGKYVDIKNNNNGALLKAALRDIFDSDREDSSSVIPENLSGHPLMVELLGRFSKIDTKNILTR